MARTTNTLIPIIYNTTPHTFFSGASSGGTTLTTSTPITLGSGSIDIRDVLSISIHTRFGCDTLPGSTDKVLKFYSIFSFDNIMWDTIDNTLLTEIKTYKIPNTITDYNISFTLDTSLLGSQYMKLIAWTDVPTNYCKIRGMSLNIKRIV